MRNDSHYDSASGSTVRLRSLERSMERVRWFGLALGIYLNFWYEPNPGTKVPRSAIPIATVGLALLLAVNIAVHLILRRPRSETTLARLGAIAFACDMAAVWTIVWAYTFEPIRPWLVPVLLVLSACKFVMVVGFYMHLKFDHALFTGVFGFGLAVAASVITALLFLFRQYPFPTHQG